MQSRTDYFFNEKIKDINHALECQCVDMFDLIGSVRDRFSSPYISTSIASLHVINDLWDALLCVFLYSTTYDNKFYAIATMSDISLYSKRRNINLRCDELEQWRKEHHSNNSTDELLECVDDILLR